MKLTLDRLDLKSQHVNTNCSLTRYEHFTDEAQAAIRVVGRAIFAEFDGRNYNVIHPPKEGESMFELCEWGRRNDVIASAPLVPAGLAQLLEAQLYVKCPTVIWIGDRPLDHERLDTMPAWNDANNFWQAYEKG